MRSFVGLLVWQVIKGFDKSEIHDVFSMNVQLREVLIMKHQYNASLNFVVAFLLCSIVGGCTSLDLIISEEPDYVECPSWESTIPNEPYSGPYPSAFNELADKNPLLAQELAKLPELQDGISEDEVRTLENLVKLYDAYPDKFDNTFKKMYETGIPKVRKYCSPLQALFWMAEEGKNKEITRLIINYSLRSLLKKAWGDFSDQDITHYKNRYLDISQEQAKQIVASLDSNEQNIYAGIDPRLIKKMILIRYDKSHVYFPREQRKIIQDSIRVSEKYLKWNHPEIIMERLNAPELLDFYIDRNISYKFEIPAFHRSPDDVINEKYGEIGRAHV